MYFTVTVKTRQEDDKGKVKTITTRYLVDALSVTEAEARTTDYLVKQGGGIQDMEVCSATQSRIASVISLDNE